MPRHTQLWHATAVCDVVFVRQRHYMQGWGDEEIDALKGKVEQLLHRVAVLTQKI
jgi:hypothetical protein